MNEVQKSAEEYDIECNSKVKRCQTCSFFQPIVFDYEEEYFMDDELGCFTLWVWEGVCTNSIMPAEGLNFYHKTKSNEKCEYYITKDEMDEFQTIIGDKESVSGQDFLRILITKIRNKQESKGADKKNGQ